MKRFLETEPALLMGLVQATITLFVLFVINLSPEQSAGIIAFSAALLSVITRSQVTPVKKGGVS